MLYFCLFYTAIYDQELCYSIIVTILHLLSVVGCNYNQLILARLVSIVLFDHQLSLKECKTVSATYMTFRLVQYAFVISAIWHIFYLVTAW